MLSSVTGIWLVLGIATMGMLAFLIGNAIDRLINENGFGPVGNAIVITAGFFLSIYLANRHGIRFRGLEVACYFGIISAMGTLLTLTIIKKILRMVAA
jgi:hypothetical protein